MSINETSLHIYNVHKIDHPIQVTGKGSDPLWKKAEVLDAFSYPWREEMAPVTKFRALWNEQHFYFLYSAFDADIIAKKQGLEERDPVNADRVEIFFKADDRMDPYYSLEMDALGRILDTEGRFYRNIDFNWNWPAGHLIVEASIDDDRYWVEGNISLESLRQLGLYKDDNLLKAGLYRGEYYTDDNGHINAKWISWVKPDSEKPDFHIPSSFGLLKLLD